MEILQRDHRLRQSKLYTRRQRDLSIEFRISNRGLLDRETGPPRPPASAVAGACTDEHGLVLLSTNKRYRTVRVFAACIRFFRKFSIKVKRTGETMPRFNCRETFTFRLVTPCPAPMLLRQTTCHDSNSRPPVRLMLASGDDLQTASGAAPPPVTPAPRRWGLGCRIRGIWARSGRNILTGPDPRCRACVSSFQPVDVRVPGVQGFDSRTARTP